MMDQKGSVAEALSALHIAIGCFSNCVRESFGNMLCKIEAGKAYFESRSLEKKGRACRDKRKRNRFFRKAKRLRKRYSLGK